MAPPAETSFDSGPKAPAVERAVRAGAPASWRARVIGIEGADERRVQRRCRGALPPGDRISILTTFLAVLGLTPRDPDQSARRVPGRADRPGVAIDYSLLVVTRWREERGARAGLGGMLVDEPEPS